MNLKILALLSIIGIAAALPYTNSIYKNNAGTRNSAIEQIVLDVLEDLRETMLNGSDDVPVLDPFELDELKLDLGDFGLQGSHVDIYDLIISNLATFVIDSLDINRTSLIPTIRYRAIFNAHVPNVDVSVNHYDLDLSHLGYNLWGNGDAKLSFIEPRVQGDILVRIRLLTGLYITIETSEVKFHLKALKSNINGLFNDQNASDFLNRVLENLVPDVIEFYEAEISEVLSEVVKDVGNEILANFDLSSIFGRDNIHLLVE